MDQVYTIYTYGLWAESDSRASNWHVNWIQYAD